MFISRCDAESFEKSEAFAGTRYIVTLEFEPE
jgi:hypothetical protein